jgi:hypothetical protein
MGAVSRIRIERRAADAAVGVPQPAFAEAPGLPLKHREAGNRMDMG